MSISRESGVEACVFAQRASRVLKRGGMQLTGARSTGEASSRVLQFLPHLALAKSPANLQYLFYGREVVPSELGLL